MDFNFLRRKFMAFKATKIIDGDTFEVSPNWKWNNQSGNRVRPTGYNAPEKGQLGYEAAKEKLEGLVLGKNIELGSAYRIDRDRLVCDVSYSGTNIADYFPEYR